LRDAPIQRQFVKDLKLVCALLRTVSEDGRTSGLFDPIPIIARVGLDVSDGRTGEL
jgi:hypothetical protein